MKKVFILFLIGTFLISVAGCTAKTDYDVLLDEKAAVQKKCNDLSSERERLKGQITSHQKQIKTLQEQLKKRADQASVLERELAKAKVKIKELQK